MANNWEKQATKYAARFAAFTGIADLRLHKAKRTIKSILKKGSYWSSIVVLGFGLTAVIMKAYGVPLVAPAHAAGIGSAIATLLGVFIYYVLVFFPGLMLAVVGWILEIVIGYPWSAFWTVTGSGVEGGGYVNVSAVITGWKLVRDVCNIFFSIILVVIALGTVLNIEAYSWKKLLNRFIVMAVLINFSKSIAGVFTDLATILMATFGASFTGRFVAGIMGAFGLPGITDVVTLDSSDFEAVEESSGWSVLFAYVAAAMMVNLSLVIFAVFTVVFIARIFILWFLIVMSPIAYIARTLPIFESKSKEWWDPFGRWVAVGPLMTFFLWMSLMMAYGTGGETAEEAVANNNIAKKFTNQDVLAQGASLGVPNVPETGTNGLAAAQPNVLANFMVAYLLMATGLMMVKKMASEAGSIVGQVEGMAGLASTQIMEKGGDVVGSLGKYWGVAPPSSGEDTRSTFQKVGHRAGQLASFAGNTVLNPVSFAKAAKAGIAASSADKKRKSKNDAMQQAGAMRSERLVGENGQMSKNPLAWMARAGGVIMGTGMDDSKHVFDNYLSGSGANRMRKLGGAMASGEYEKLSKAKDAAAADAEHLKNVENAYGSEGDVAHALQEKSAAEAIVEGLKSGGAVDIDMDGSQMAGVVDGAIAALQAAKTAAAESNAPDAAAQMAAIDNNIETLQDAKNNGYDGSLADLATMATDNVADSGARARITEGLNGGLGAVAANQANNITQKLKSTGLDANGAGDAVYSTTNNIDAARAAASQSSATYDSMNYQLAGLEAGTNYDARVAQQSLVSEELKKMQDIANTDELKGIMQRALTEGNKYMAEAVLHRITQNGDENELYQGFMAQHVAKMPQSERERQLTDSELSSYGFEAGTKMQVQDLARSDDVGAEFFRQAILRDELGVDDQGSMRVMNDLSYAAEKIGHNGPARAYAYRGGKWSKVSRAEQQASVAGEKAKEQPSNYAGWNRLGWGYEDKDRKFHFNESGLELLRSSGEDLADVRNFRRMNANVKSRFAERIKEMRNAGVSETFVAKIEEFAREQKKAQNKVARAIKKVT